MSDAGVERDQKRQRREDRCGRPDHRDDRPRGACLRQKSRDAEAHGEDGGRYQMQRHRSVRGARPDALQGAAGQYQHVRIGAHGPFGEYDEDESRGSPDRACGGIAAPGDHEAACHQQAEQDHRGVGMKTVQHDQGRAEQIGRERAGRDRLDLAFIRGRAEHEATYHEECGEDEAGQHVERVRGHHRRAALQAGKGPQQREGNGGDREPAPHPDARQAERRRSDDREVDVERPEIRLAGRDQDRGCERADDAETGQRRPMQQRSGQRAHRHHAEQHEGGGGYQEFVQRVGRIDGRKRDRRSGRGEDGGDIGDRRCFDRGDAFLAARPFARQQQGQRKQSAQKYAYARADQSGLDRIAHHEETAERERQPADPHHPARADGLLKTATGRRHWRWRRRRSVCGLFGRLGRGNGLCIGNEGRQRRHNRGRSRRQRPLERFEWWERRRHRRSGGRRRRLDRLQALA